MANPSEHQEQVAVATWLRRRGINFFAVPNGAYCTPNQKNKLRAEGLTAGVADLVIVDPPRHDTALVVGLEMKRRRGGVISHSQKRWRDELPDWWVYVVANGAEDAISKLRELGYGR